MPKIVSPKTWGQEFDVKAYGAIGNGVATDGPAILAAMTACAAAGGGVVNIPPGTYKVTTTIVLPIQALGSMTVRGAGPESTKINFSGTGYCFEFGDGGVNNSQYQYIEDMTILGDATNSDGGIRFNHTRFCGVTKCRIGDFTKAGAIGINMITAQHNYFALISNCKIANTPTGIKMSSDTGTGIGANSNLVRQCHFGAHTSYAIHIDGGDTNTVEYCEFNGSVTTAMYLEGTITNTKLLYNQYDGPTTSVNIAASTVSGTVILGSSGSATITDAGSNTTVLNAAELYTRNGMIVKNGLNSTIPLRVRAASGQSTQIFAIQDNAGTTTYFYIDQAGNMDVRGSFSTHTAGTFKADIGGNSHVVTIDSQGSATSSTNLRLAGRSSGTQGDFMRVLASNLTTIYSRFDKDGYFGTQKIAAPADAAVNTSEGMLWWTDTIGATHLMVKGKDSAGTVVSHTLQNATDVSTAISTALALADGSGLTETGGVISVGPGTGITVNADDVALSATVAGNGLTHTAGVLNIVGDASISVTSDQIALAAGVAGNGLTLTTGVLAVGGGTGITVTADGIAINTAVVVQKYAQNVGALTANTPATITHNLNSLDILAQLIDISTGELSLATIKATAVNTLSITTDASYAADTFRIVVHS